MILGNKTFAWARVSKTHAQQHYQERSKREKANECLEYRFFSPRSGFLALTSVNSRAFSRFALETDVPRKMHATWFMRRKHFHMIVVAKCFNVSIQVSLDISHQTSSFKSSLVVDMQ